MFAPKNAVFSLLRKPCPIRLPTRCASHSQRQSKMLAKLLTGKKKPYFTSNDLPSIKNSSPFDGIHQKPTKMTNRRLAVLNKMFMRHVTDIIANGPKGYELNQVGLEITQVKVCQKFHGLNIFWSVSGTDDFESVERNLESIRKDVRHELHQMQLMGNIPHITFVRDYQRSYYDELDARIAQADYGDDYEPTPTKSRVKSDFDIAGQVTVGSSESSEDENKVASLMPPMRYDVFGVDHSLIMGRIKQALAKSKQAWKALEGKTTIPPSAPPYTGQTTFESIRVEHTSSKQSADLLKEYLSNRRRLRKQQRKDKIKFDSMLLDEMNDMKYGGDNNNNDEDWFEDDDEIQKFYDELEQDER